MLAAFPAGDVVSVVTRGGCSCDLSGQPHRRFDEAAEREKYRKKGWSAPKIERAILGRRPDENPHFAAFRATFSRLVSAAGAARILACSFSGDVATEAVRVSPGGVLRLDDYLARRGTFAEGALHDVRAT